jgi:hypothetical protein
MKSPERSNRLRLRFLHWLGRTPVQTFILRPFAVFGFELAYRGGSVEVVPWALPLIA